jgi:hypothetical protein
LRTGHGPIFAHDDLVISASGPKEDGGERAAGEQNRPSIHIFSSDRLDSASNLTEASKRQKAEGRRQNKFKGGNSLILPSAFSARPV